jgi:Glycosyl hydrolase family 115
LRYFLLIITLAAFAATPIHAQSWDAPVRGSWVQHESPQKGDVVLVKGSKTCEIVVADNENSAVKQAAAFLAGDIEAISGHRPSIVTRPTRGRVSIRLVTLGLGKVPGSVNSKMQGQWEAHQVLTLKKSIWLVGSNFRGTAFAAYTLSERLGVDPLHHWTGYTPAKANPLVVKKIDYRAAPPTVKYRGFFHDDEDILPRPLDNDGLPPITGTVPKVWYERFFETALRLRMNQVAPYVRVQRPFDVQKTASDWGLFYTSHHYDTLLSNPWGYKRFGLAEERNAGSSWDWFSNQQGMVNFWRGGLMENRELDCIWPVGMRGTQDTSYKFPKGMSSEKKGEVFKTVIQTQVDLVKELLPEGKQPIYHFTLYGEMLRNYKSGNFDFPEEVILVWDDNGDALMRGLPETLGKWKHGVYYHLAFLGGGGTKQLHHTITPQRIEQEFRMIVSSGATEYMLCNLSEMREYVMNARFISEICWDAKTAFKTPKAAERYSKWWCQEYFGAEAADDAYEVYRHYWFLIDSFEKLSHANKKVHGALGSLVRKFNDELFYPANSNTLPMLEKRGIMYERALKIAEKANKSMSEEQRRYFFENATLGLMFDYYPTKAAILLVEAMEEPDLKKAWSMCEQAMPPLEELEREIKRAERPPFDTWYNKTWIRTNDNSKRSRQINAHRPYLQLQSFLSNQGKKIDPKTLRR